VIVVDTSIIVAIIREETEASVFIDILDDTAAVMSAVSYVETQMVIAGRKPDADPRRVELTAADLGIEIIDVTRDQADAADRALLLYGRGHHRARLNSCALAKSRGLLLLFTGDDFATTDIVAARPL